MCPIKISIRKWAYYPRIPQSRQHRFELVWCVREDCETKVWKGQELGRNLSLSKRLDGCLHHLSKWGSKQKADPGTTLKRLQSKPGTTIRDSNQPSPRIQMSLVKGGSQNNSWTRRRFIGNREVGLTASNGVIEIRRGFIGRRHNGKRRIEWMEFFTGIIRGFIIWIKWRKWYMITSKTSSTLNAIIVKRSSLVFTRR